MLANRTIYINIIKQLNDSPLFLVNVFKCFCNKYEEAYIDVNDWIFGRLMLELRGISYKDLKPVGDYLSPEAIDAYFTQCVDEFDSDSPVFQYNSDGTLQIEVSWSAPVYWLSPESSLCVE